MGSKREYYISHPEDDTNTFEKKMNQILGRDDPNMLHEYLRGFPDNFHYAAILDMCLEKACKRCALHIIEGKLPHGHPDLFFDNCDPCPDVPVFYYVIHMMSEPHVFQELMYGCGLASQVNEPFQDLLPLHWLLDLLTELPPFSVWFPGQSLYTIVDSLFMPEVMPKLQCAQMLAQCTRSLDQIALAYIDNGEIVPLAALFLIAEFTEDEYKKLKLYTDVASQAIYSQCFKYSLASALLFIFDKDGNHLKSKFKNLQKGIPVEDWPSIVHLFVSKRSNINFDRRWYSKETDRIGMSILRSKANSDPRYESVLREVTVIHHEAKISCSLDHIYQSWRCDYPLGPCLSKDDISCQDTLHLHYLEYLLKTVAHHYLPTWSLGQSLLKLIILVILQKESEPMLTCAQCLAEGNMYVNELAWNLIQQGKIKELAVLLLIAHREVFKAFSSGDSLIDATSMENVVSQVLYGVCVPSTVAAAALLGIFEITGAALANLWLEVKKYNPAEVIVKTAVILNEGGIQVCSTDADLTELFNQCHPEILQSTCHLEILKSTCESLGVKIDDIIQVNEPPFPIVKNVKARCQPEVPTYDYQRIRMMEVVAAYCEGLR